jgi:hypothetical protein
MSIKKISLNLFAALIAACGASAPVLAQQQSKPNILVIMGDDVGWFNIGAYHQGIMSGKTPISTSSHPKGCGSPTITPRQAARQAGPTSSPASYRYAQD